MRACEPSERNFLIYCAIEFDGCSLRQVAAEHQISPTRVQQVVAQVRQWFDATTPQWVRERSSAMQPFVACRVHDQRLAYYISQTMEAWRASQGEVTVKQDRGQLGGVMVTTRPAYGDTRYLMQAARLSQMQVSSAVRLAKLLEKLHKAAASLPAEAIEETATDNPCAPEGIETVASEPVATEEPAVTPEATERYEDAAEFVLPNSNAAARCANPVRSRLERKLTRQQRRKAARQKQRQRAVA